MDHGSEINIYTYNNSLAIKFLKIYGFQRSPTHNILLINLALTFVFPLFNVSGLLSIYCIYGWVEH